MRHRYLRPLLGTPGAAAGYVLGTAIAYALWKGSPLREAFPWAAASLLLILAKRGLSIDPATREIRVGAGLGFARCLVPIWPWRRREFRRVIVRFIQHWHPKGGKAGTQPAVWLLDAQDRGYEVGRTWTHSAATRLAEQVSREAGLPWGDGDYLPRSS